MINIESPYTQRTTFSNDIPRYSFTYYKAAYIFEVQYTVHTNPYIYGWPRNTRENKSYFLEKII